MARKTKTQMEKITKALKSSKATAGVSAAAIAKAAGVAKDTVYKRISDLRDTHKVFTNYRLVNGRRKAYYRLAV